VYKAHIYVVAAAWTANYAIRNLLKVTTAKQAANTRANEWCWRPVAADICAFDSKTVDGSCASPPDVSGVVGVGASVNRNLFTASTGSSTESAAGGGVVPDGDSAVHCVVPGGQESPSPEDQNGQHRPSLDLHGPFESSAQPVHWNAAADCSDCIGVTVGEAVCDNVGLSVGCNVVSGIGPVVGFFVGEPVGWLVVGPPVGTAVGVGVGKLVGDDVGRLVGTPVASA